MPMRRRLLMLWKMWVKGRTLRMCLLASMAERKIVVVVDKVLAMVSALVLLSVSSRLEILPLLLCLRLLLMVERGDLLEILVLLAGHTHTQPHFREGIPAMSLLHCPNLFQLHKSVSLLVPLLGRRLRARML
jgi:hypothetical protein